MSEGTYEYECMRAELLGIEKPDYEEFMKNKETEIKAVEEDEQDTEQLKEIDSNNEANSRIMGGLEELNSILQKTQSKIYRFKASCGSLTNLLRVRISGKSDSATSLHSITENVQAETEETLPNEQTTTDNSLNENLEKNTQGSSATGSRKRDLTKALDSDLGRLDTMLEKAENAQYSMAHQNKEMKRFLKK